MLRRSVELKFKGETTTRKTRTKWRDWAVEDIRLKIIRKRENMAIFHILACMKQKHCQRKLYAASGILDTAKLVI
jgi:hypothetical protein